MDKLSPSFLHFLRSTFDDFDTDRDGKLTKDDIERMMRFSGQNPTAEQVLAQFHKFDLDGNKTIDFSEYATVLAKQMNANGKAPEDGLKKSFQCLDKDGDGFISREDLSKVLFDHQKIDNILKKFDKDQDGKLSYSEFGEWVKENKILGELFSVDQQQKQK